MSENDEEKQVYSPPEDSLAHYGKKGMKWGVRNDDKPKGEDSSAPEIDKAAMRAAFEKLDATTDKAQLQSDSQRKLEAQAAQTFPFEAKQAKRDEKAGKLQEQADKWDAEGKALQEKRDALPDKGIAAAYKKKSLDNQIEFSNQQRDQLLKKADQVKSGKLTSDQKALLALGATAAIAGLAIYGSNRYKLNQAGLSPALVKQAKEENKRKTEAEWKEMFGEDRNFESASTYYGATGPGFHTGLLPPPNALDRPGFTIPEGTVFQRLSNAQEDSSRYGVDGPAYTTFLTNDKHMYSASGEFGGAQYTVNYTAKGPVRVPSMATTLSHYRKALEAEYPNSPFSDDDVVTLYRGTSGGDWKGGPATRMLKSLREEGYSALVDDMDAGFMGDLPIVFFGDANPATSTPRNEQTKTRDTAALLKVGGRYA